MNSTGTITASASENVTTSNQTTSLATVLSTLDSGADLSSLTIILVFIGLVGCINNVLCIVVICSSRVMRQKITNKFITNQSVADFLSSFFLIFTSLFASSDVTSDGPASQLYCRIWYSQTPLWAAFFASIFNLMSITVERWLSVEFAIKHRLFYSRRVAQISILITWVGGAALSVFSNVPNYVIVADQCAYVIWNDAQTQLMMGVVTFLVSYVIPIVTFVFCYSRIAMVLRRQVKVHPARGGGQHSINSSSKVDKAQRNAIKTMVIVCVSFFICFTGNQILFLLGNVGLNTIQENGLVYNVVLVMFAINGAMNPFIYASHYKEFQNTLIALVCRRKSHGLNALTTVSVNLQGGNKRGTSREE